MRRVARCVVVVLACAVAVSCGSSNPAGPDDPPSGGGGGGGGGGTSGGSGPRGITAVYTDGELEDSGWDAEVVVSGRGGDGAAGHLNYLGAANGDYRQVTITVNSAEGSTSPAQVAVFSIKRGVVYFPSSDGTIFTVDYSEDSILLSGGGNGQYSAPVIKQNGKYYTLVPGGGAFTTPDATWTNHSLTGLRQNDFRTLDSASDHPDFSTTGARIEVGFMRLHNVPAGNAGSTRRGGLDNWRIVFNR